VVTALSRPAAAIAVFSLAEPDNRYPQAAGEMRRQGNFRTPLPDSLTGYLP
jgi:hypothetical protein